MTALNVSNISKHYGKHLALDGFSYSFSSGIYALLGPNGAGKSSFMNILAGILPQDKGGTVTLNGIERNQLKNKYKSFIGYMPQQQALPEGFTTERFIGYIAGLKGIDKKSAEAQMHELLGKVELSDHTHSKIGSFSGGMKQRLLFTQAMLGTPDILILDEPTSGLDPRQRVIMRSLIKEYAKERIVIISTHIVSDIENIADEVILLKSGKIVASGKTNQLLERENCSDIEKLYMKHFEKVQHDESV
ncbi:MAG: ATP-binding cassette domain-containing protein [Oscillospiraceae bacterium]